MNKIVPTTTKLARPVIDAAFPGYTGRKVRIEFCLQVTLYDLNWSGGTKNTYAVVSNTGSGFSSRYVPAPAPWDNPYEGMVVKLTPNILIVEHTQFCGKDLGIRIYAHQDYAHLLLPLLPVGDQP